MGGSSDLSRKAWFSQHGGPTLNLTFGIYLVNIAKRCRFSLQHPWHSTKIIAYFESTWASDNRQLLQPSPLSTMGNSSSSLPPPIVLDNKQASPSPNIPRGNQLQLQPTNVQSFISRTELHHLLESKEAQIQAYYTPHIQHLKNENSAKKLEIQTLKQTVDLLQTQIQDFTRQPPASQGLYGQTPTTLPVQQYSVQPASNFTAQQSHAYGGYGTALVDQDLLMTTDLKAEDHNTARVSRKTVQFVGPIQSRVFVDFVCLEQVITAEWKVYVYPGQNLQLGFIMDVMGDLRQESNERILVEYSSSGLLSVRNHTYPNEPIQFNDTITLEINCPDRSARIFKNGKQLPYIIKRIPLVNKLYVSGTGPQNRADLVKLTQTSSPGTYPNIQTQEIFMDRL
ncbi:hypothetical protein BLNAU_11538 [Blattamonas nauphoetae]|uniref:SPRY domain-containing protein n=1 Tax=Blattamonas nauphoetae TaxID=2049346 RepID=A0ABQ9XQD1_9EUKA|nr:hypothetical protein BLNAU_11538 [Blattamonas nauphoetae]